MNVRLTWTLPTPTQRQRPIAHVRIAARVEGIEEWTVLNTVEPPTTELLIEGVDPGSWQYTGTVFDDSGAKSGTKVASVEVPFDPPSELETFGAALE